MKRVSTGLLLGGTLLVLGGCSNEEGFRVDGEQGKITLDLSTDSRVLMNTRADDTKVSVIPEASKFAILFEKQDGSFSQKWANVNLFNKEASFPIGTYTLSATYGNPEKEGFELPYFYAEQEVTVESGIESHVNLTASLANSMVSVRYTDEFIGHFEAYSAALKSESSPEYVIFAQNEDRAAYMKPEKISLRLTLTNMQGQQVKVSPYSFTASPQHHYIVTMGVKDSQGSNDMSLDVQITEDVTSEFVEISLGDDLFSAPKPSVKAYDFPASMKYEDFEGFDVSGDPRIDVLAYGGLKKVNLNVTSSNTLIFGNTVQFVNADALTQANVASTGLEVSGFYRNPDKAGVIKFKDFLSNLPEGVYKISVDAEDSRTLSCDEPVEFNVVVKAVNIKLGVTSHPEYMGDEMTVTVTTNKPDVKSKVRFEVTDANEQWQPATIITDPVLVRSGKTTRAEQQYTYSYRLSIPVAEHHNVKVRAFYGAETSPKDEITDEGVIFPDYTIQVDAYANKGIVKVIPADPSKLDIIMNNLKLVLNNNERPLSVYDASKGLFIVQGLDPNTTYNSFETFLSYIDNPHYVGDGFKTEAETDVTNGTFDNNIETIRLTNVNVGGKFRTTAFAIHNNTTNIIRSTPVSWATVNDLTCWKGSSTINTWFVVPSTYSDNGKVVIVSVGYSHNGTEPAQTGGLADQHYYCQNSPKSEELQKASGELFLGSYSYDGTEHRTDGIAFSSRPEYISFKYSYAGYNNESGEAYAEIYDASGALISSGVVELTNSQDNTGVIKLSEYPFGKKASKLILCFRSTMRNREVSVNIPTQDQLNESSNGVSYNDYRTKDNKYNAVALGSCLTIDDVKIGYDMTSEQSVRNSFKKRNGSARKSNRK